jgi:hypothetical protein
MEDMGYVTGYSIKAVIIQKSKSSSYETKLYASAVKTPIPAK